MILLPERPALNGAQPALIDHGRALRPSTGARVQRLNRKGNRFRIMASLPPMEPEVSRIFVSRLLDAKADPEGLRIPFPLSIDQGAPGAGEVASEGQAGTSLAVRGLTRGYWIKEGYWLSIENAAGQHYLHRARGAVQVDGAGNAVIPIGPELRWPFEDGARVHLAKPMIEGFVEGDEYSWTIPVNKLIALEFPLEEWG